MFNNNKNEANKAKNAGILPSSSSHALNSLVKGTIVEGTVKSENDIRVDGVIRGKLFCDAKVIIGATGFVEGEIRCKNAVIEGRFEGMLEVGELLNVRETAKISGEVHTGKLIVQSGATFNVSCTMGAKGIQTNNKAQHLQVSSNADLHKTAENGRVAKEAKAAGV